MNVLSLFDGISCGQLALKRAGIKVDKYFASEIDQGAIKVCQSNFPSTFQICDVRGDQFLYLPHITLLMAGSPCQGFSFAGKQLNFSDPRSELFFKFYEIKTLLMPKYFLLENVVMKKEYQNVISEYLGVEPVMINSNIFSAQNRKRLYWTNINIPALPDPSSLLLKDILDRGELDSYLTLDQIDRGKYKYSGKTWKSGNRMGNMRFPDDTNKKSKSLCSTIIKGSRETVHIEDELGIRILTPLEFERLQGLIDGYTAGPSNKERLKQIGNGWNIDTIAHILKGIIT